MTLYEDKPFEYYRSVRIDILGALQNAPFKKVLELGAGGCNTLAYMKEKKLAEEVTAVELFDLPGSNQQNPVIDKLIIGDVGLLDTFDVKQNYYDLIICGDVLEHTYSPWEIVEKARKLLTSDGILICSLPNFRFFRNMQKIFFKGDFSYTTEGTLDKTHIRFFCKRNLVQLFEGTGYKVKKIEPGFYFNQIERKRKTINKLTFGLFEEFLAFQYIIQVTKG